MEDVKVYYALTRKAFDLLAPFYDLLTLPLLSVRGQAVDFANAAKKVLQEMARVTRPGGVIVIVDYGLPRNKWGQALVYSLVSLYEAEYYRQFIVSDLEALLQ